MQVAAFPVSVNGKTDRNALPDPLESDRCSATEITEADPADDDDNDCEGSEYDRNEDEAKRESPSKKDARRLQSDMRGVTFDEHKAAKMAMAKHVIDMVEKVSLPAALSMTLYHLLRCVALFQSSSDRARYSILILHLTVHISIIYLFLLQPALNCHHYYDILTA